MAEGLARLGVLGRRDALIETRRGLTIEEMPGMAVRALSVPAGGEDAASAALRSVLGLALPSAGRFAAAGPHRLAASGLRQWMWLEEDGDPDAGVPDALANVCRVTPLSDGWGVVRLRGPRWRAAMELLCPLDWHPSAWSADSAARAPIEDLAALILAEGEEGVMLAFARSSARSFVHHLQTAASTVAGDPFEPRPVEPPQASREETGQAGSLGTQGNADGGP